MAARASSTNNEKERRRIIKFSLPIAWLVDRRQTHWHPQKSHVEHKLGLHKFALRFVRMKNQRLAENEVSINLQSCSQPATSVACERSK